MKEKILEELRKNKGEYLSGELISNMLGCSRTAVWKHIDELRAQGHRIESVHRKGYALVAELDPIAPEYWKHNLTTKKIGQTAFFYPVLDTTQAKAHQLAKEGAEEGTVVLADLQTGGKGRLGRQWHSPVGAGIWASFIIRPNIPLQAAPQITLLAAAAVARTIRSYDLEVQIKWPNDIFIHGKKISGILTELQGDLDRVGYIVLGIGINVHQVKEDFPNELRGKATSFSIERPDVSITRSKLFVELCQQLETLFQLYLEHGFSVIKVLWESYAIPMGSQIKVSTLQRTFIGKAIGITEQGILIVEDQDGVTHHIHSADIEISARSGSL